MAVSLKTALAEFSDEWAVDLEEPWRALLGHVQLATEAVAAGLELEIWEPIVPARKGKHFPGMPPGTHCLQAFEGIAPEQVRCVILGQDPYPEHGFATGRTFEAGNLVTWRTRQDVLQEHPRIDAADYRRADRRSGIRPQLRYDHEPGVLLARRLNRMRCAAR